MSASPGLTDGHGTPVNSTPSQSQSQHINLTDDMSSDTAVIDYWTRLIRSNLATLVRDTDSDTEEVDSATQIDEKIMNAPRRKSAQDAIARQVAAQLYPSVDLESLAPIIKYEKDIVMLRNVVLEQRRQAIADATARNESFNWIKRISKSGPWNEKNDPLPLNGAPSLPMPVQVSDKESLAPFFAHLRNKGTSEPSSASTDGYTTGIEPYYGTELIEFEKGVLYSDGRVDLCKMVTGPRNIGDLMESLKTNTFSKHFLLGNNIIGPIGAKAIADFIDEYPERFETWYLAGNCIDTASFTTLVNSMVKSPAITNVWLKRNPLGPSAAADVVRLIKGSPHLRTLDLDQTELGDAGVAELFSSLASLTTPPALRHIYLNATGIGENGCKAISSYLASPHCGLHSLYMSNNPVGDAGVLALAPGLQDNKSLKRLSLQSCGLKDITPLFDALSGHPTIEVLDVGQSYATEDLGMRYNWLTDANVPAINNFIDTTPQLKYLNLAYVPISQQELNKVFQAVAASNLIWFHAKALVTGEKDAVSVKAGQEHARLHAQARKRLHANVEQQYCMNYEQFESSQKRFLVSPQDVRFIDSVYRNRDAGAARRGLKKLVKHWEEGDETLQRVQDGARE